jgi:hypothetical protein
LIEQLAASHAAQRELAKRLDERERHYKDRMREQEQQHKKCMREQEQHHQHRVSELQTELSQCQKRETAVREVFSQNFETTNSIARERLELRELEARLASKEKQLDREHMKLVIEKSSFHSATYETADSLQVEYSPSDSSKSQDIKKKNPDWRWIPKVGKTPSFKTFLNEPCFKEYGLPISIEQMNDPAIELMKRRDYYLGWLDCSWANYTTAHAHMFPECALLFEKASKYLFNAGANVGALLGWAKMCEEEKVDWGVRVYNTRKCIAFELFGDKKTPAPPSDFWRGLVYGREVAEAKFAEECAKDVCVS